MSAAHCAFRTTECEEDYLMCEAQPVCGFAWRRCWTITSEWRSRDGELWAIYHDDLGPLWRSRGQCETGTVRL